MKATKKFPRHDGQQPSPSNPEGWAKSVTIQGLRWRLFSIAELTEHPLNKVVYGNSKPSKELIDSIREVGVLSPLIVNKDRQILSGTQRWKALQILAKEGRHSVTSAYDGSSCVYAVCANDKEGKGLAGERLLIESNRQRVKSTEQKAREFKELKRIETALTKERETQRKKSKTPKATKPILAESPKIQSRVKAAAIVGLKPTTAVKLEKLVDAADGGNEEARTALDQVNEGTKTVHAAVREILTPKSSVSESEAAIKQRAANALAKTLTALFKNGEVQRAKDDGLFHIVVRSLTEDNVRALAKFALANNLYYDTLSGNVWQFDGTAWALLATPPPSGSYISFEDDFTTGDQASVAANKFIYAGEQNWTSGLVGGHSVEGVAGTIAPVSGTQMNPGRISLSTNANCGLVLFRGRNDGFGGIVAPLGVLGSFSGWQIDCWFSTQSLEFGPPFSEYAVRIGFCAVGQEGGDSPTGGAWIEFDSANANSSSGFVLRTVNSGTSTYVPLGLVPQGSFSFNHVTLASPTPGTITCRLVNQDACFSASVSSSTNIDTSNSCEPMMQITDRSDEGNSMLIDRFSYSAPTGRI